MADATMSAAPARRSFFGRFNLEVRGHMSRGQQILIVSAGIFVGLAVSALLLIVSGVEPSGLLNEFVVAIFKSQRNVAAVLSYAAPLTIVGLSAAVAFKARFWNIGIEGQVIFGAIGATLVANHDVGPPAVRLVLMALAAIAAGMLWIALPLFLKLRLQVNEIISTGIESRLTQSFFIGYGFSGILIAFLARNNPFAVAFFAILIAVLMVAGQSLQVFYQIPFAMVQLIQAIIVICVAASEFFIHYRLRLVE